MLGIQLSSLYGGRGIRQELTLPTDIFISTDNSTGLIPGQIPAKTLNSNLTNSVCWSIAWFGYTYGQESQGWISLIKLVPFFSF